MKLIINEHSLKKLIKESIYEVINTTTKNVKKEIEKKVAWYISRNGREDSECIEISAYKLGLRKFVVNNTRIKSFFVYDEAVVSGISRDGNFVYLWGDNGVVVNFSDLTLKDQKSILQRLKKYDSLYCRY